MSSDCVFCKIAVGEIPSFKIYEDETTFAFLDVTPVTRGHVLVIPKAHHKDMFDMSDELMADIGRATRRVVSLLEQKLGVTACNLFNNSGKIAGQGVFHFHMHIAPRWSDDEVRFNFHDFAKKASGLEELHQQIVG